MVGMAPTSVPTDRRDADDGVVARTLAALATPAGQSVPYVGTVGIFAAAGFTKVSRPTCKGSRCGSTSDLRPAGRRHRITVEDATASRHQSSRQFRTVNRPRKARKWRVDSQAHVDRPRNQSDVAGTG